MTNKECPESLSINRLNSLTERPNLKETMVLQVLGSEIIRHDRMRMRLSDGNFWQSFWCLPNIIGTFQADTIDGSVLECVVCY